MKVMHAGCLNRLSIYYIYKVYMLTLTLVHIQCSHWRKIEEYVLMLPPQRNDNEQQPNDNIQPGIEADEDGANNDGNCLCF